MTPTAQTKSAAEPVSVSNPLPKSRGGHWLSLAISIFLAAIVWAVFGRTIHYDFVNFDDDEYVYENPMVAGGLTERGVLWAFTRFHSNNWHPLTWVSHMADCEFYGLDAGGHHLTNVLLHAAAAILLFLVLRSATGFLWRSAFVAAIFAIHPLRVESVAWVSERKDILSGIFFMLTIAAYLYYVRRSWSSRRYGLVLVLFGLGLMCKPMLVTLPVILLLLDYWPLNRFQSNAAEPRFGFATLTAPKRLVLEKLPLLGLSLASAAITFLAQSSAKASFEQLSFSSRVINAVISCAVYLRQMFWPSQLAIPYPYPAHPAPVWATLLAIILLGAVSVAVFAFRKTRPYLLVGWLWYLVMLAPVIGVFQVGAQAHADRYTYLPQIGAAILLTWMAAEWLGRWHTGRFALTLVSLAAVAVLMACARAQAAYWQSSETLWTHTLACTSNNYIAEDNLGIVLLKKHDVTEAINHFRNALAIHPRGANAHANLGFALQEEGEWDAAVAEFQKASGLEPKNAEFHNDLGNIFFQQNKVTEAVAQFEAATQIAPNDLAAQSNLGNALLRAGNTNAAIPHYEKALALARATGRMDITQQLSTALNALRNESPAPK